MPWIRERALTLALLALFAFSFAAQVVAGHREYNEERLQGGASALDLGGYVRTGHMWEAVFENWESEFLQMAAFIVLTVGLVQKGSPESRRPYSVELTDADPRDFAWMEDAPWPVRRGGWVLWVYERSLGLAFALLFVIAWSGHAVSGWQAERSEALLDGQALPSLSDYVRSSRFWFESMQNWQSEFLAIALMVWLAVYLRQRGSPESKPVHAPHAESGR